MSWSYVEDDICFTSRQNILESCELSKKGIQLYQQKRSNSQRDIKVKEYNFR